jgi:hypothetical protein
VTRQDFQPMPEPCLQRLERLVLVLQGLPREEEDVRDLLEIESP